MLKIVRGEGDRRELHIFVGGPGPEGRRANPVQYREEEGAQLDQKHPLTVRPVLGPQPNRPEPRPSLLHGHRTHQNGKHLQSDHPRPKYQPLR